MKRPKKKPRPLKELCRRCDGCGWYEGGQTLITICEQCDGKGEVRVRAPREAPE